MPETIPDNSVGLVTPESIYFKQSLALDCGREIENYTLVYETYGQLNQHKTNAILICHALSSDHHVAGYNSMKDRKPGWWDTCVGPGKVIDTNRFFVVCSNNLGGCKGSTGPMSINPTTQKPYGPDFPIMTVKDWVRSQAQLTERLGISQWFAVVGGSLGGMQVIQWTIDYPEQIKNALVIAAASKLTAQNIAFNEVARQAIMTDPDFHQGRYYEHNTIPKRGLMLARMLGHITYLSDDAMREKFGRDLREGTINYGFDVDFEVESYLRYQGAAFVDRFDANTYLLMTKALDYFDPASNFDNQLGRAFAATNAKFLVISFTSDWRFSPARSHEIVKGLLDSNKQVTYLEINAHQGHDAFLMPIPEYLLAYKAYMDFIAQEAGL
ncbi:Homoserine O-acetyltransferase [hydrothermal vent metagenome]|uniref:Homoserine O-acetyltransferase n=1 Tax=hydrothermal vent metagenome TaxID=652676 RepID=A0A3B0XSJ8_9ZZZZ